MSKVSTCEIVVISISDHAPVSLSLQLWDEVKPQQSWRLNVSLLNDEDDEAAKSVMREKIIAYAVYKKSRERQGRKVSRRSWSIYLEGWQYSLLRTSTFCQMPKKKDELASANPSCWAEKVVSRIAGADYGVCALARGKGMNVPFPQETSGGVLAPKGYSSCLFSL